MTINLHHGDCLEMLRAIPADSVDSIVTDPPYGLSDHEPAEVLECLKAWIAGEPYIPKGKGFMGKKWDAWVPGPEIWRECLRVVKPGGHLLAFAGTRSMDLMSMAVRLAGFELRDSIGYAHDGGGAPLLCWAFGSGFPKSRDVSKAIDKEAGVEREVVGPNPTFRPATRENGTDGLRDRRTEANITAPATEAAKQWQGWGSALKPAWEPIILARKPLIGTIAANVLAHGTGALNIDGCRVPTDETITAARNIALGSSASGVYGAATVPGVCVQPPGGRWPANLIHDGSPEVVALFPQAKGQQGAITGREPSGKMNNTFGAFAGRATSEPRGDTGSAARFFYAAKASRKDRGEGNTHCTVKPTDLMRYLCRLVTPPGGVVLDPFMGSGSTGKAARLEGLHFVGIEREAEYVEIARARIGAAAAPATAGKPETLDLFAEVTP